MEEEEMKNKMIVAMSLVAAGVMTYLMFSGLDEMCIRDRFSFGTEVTGGAWLSSARVVRCWVKSRNERNPYC